MNPIAANPLAHAFGWTLFHFCWQGAAVALLLWCVLGALGTRSSQLRYAAASTALALMVVLPLVTFIRLAIQDYRLAALTRAPIQVADIFVTAGTGTSAFPWTTRFSTALDSALPWLLAAWCVGVACFLVRLGLGLLAARTLRATGDAVPARLRHVFDELRVRLGISRAVELLQSARVEVPTVIGWLRPVVLLPASCMCGLAPEQIEAILCHELAHIRRHDYLVSVLQSVVETLLFYHPAVWWVSRQLRRERECCCDEFAVRAGGNVLAYARALALLEEQRSLAPQFALGANGGVLKMRIQRLLSRPQNSTASQFASIAVLVLLAITALAAAGRMAWAESHTAVPGQPPSPRSAPAGTTSSSADASDSTAELRDELQELGRLEESRQQLGAQVDTIHRQEADYHALLAQADRRPQISDEERARLEDAAQRLADTINAWADQLTRQVSDRDEAMARFNSPEFQRQMADALARADSTDFRKQMADAQAALARMKAQDFGRQMAAMDAMKQRLNSEEMQRQMETAKAAMSKIDSAQLQKQMEMARAALDKINTPELRKQMEEAVKAQSRINSPELQKQMEAAAKAAQAAQADLYKRGQSFGAEPQLFAKNAAPAAVEAPLPEEQPVQPNPSGSQRVSAGVMQGMVISQPPPVYPAEAKAAHVQGVVVLHAILSKEGKVENLQVVSGSPMLVKSAIDAVQQWTYRPYMLNGQPVEVETTINVNYTFGGDDSKPSQPEGPGASAAPNPDSSAPTQPVADLAPVVDRAGNPVRRIGGSVSAPLVVYQVQPEFSDEARARAKAEGKGSNVGGTVLVQLIVNAEGQPENVHVVRGVGMGLDEKAVEAVSQYRFKPAIENGAPVPVALNIEVNFRTF